MKVAVAEEECDRMKRTVQAGQEDQAVLEESATGLEAGEHLKAEEAALTPAHV